MNEARTIFGKGVDDVRIEELKVIDEEDKKDPQKVALKLSELVKNYLI